MLPNSVKPKQLITNGAKRYRWSLKRDKDNGKRPFQSNGSYLTSAVDSLFCRSAIRGNQEGDGASVDENGCGIRMCQISESGMLDDADGALSEASSSSSPPDSSFTRTISDPEAMMQRTRQQTLGAKLSQITANGCMNMGMSSHALFALSSKSPPAYQTKTANVSRSWDSLLMLPMIRFSIKTKNWNSLLICFHHYY